MPKLHISASYKKRSIDCNSFLYVTSLGVCMNELPCLVAWPQSPVWSEPCSPATQPPSLGRPGIMEKKMETTLLYWGYIGNNGKESGNYYSITALNPKPSTIPEQSQSSRISCRPLSKREFTRSPVVKKAKTKGILLKSSFEGLTGLGLGFKALALVFRGSWDVEL